jgi:aspartyl/asparaginyl beta-hydroxylase (cupin superfamily)
MIEEALIDWREHIVKVVINWAEKNNYTLDQIKRLLHSIKKSDRSNVEIDDNVPCPKLFCEGLDPRPWYTKKDFPWISVLEQNFSTIKTEFEKCVNSKKMNVSFHADSKELTGTVSWDTVLLYNHRGIIKKNSILFPETVKLLASTPTDNNILRAMFSILPPNIKINPHYGPHNFRIRFHLGITIPKGDCAIQVAGTTKHWEEGNILIFDDSFKHEVWNNTDSTRVILLFDIWHPSLSKVERKLIRYVALYTLKMKKRGIKFTNQPDIFHED